MDVLPFKSIGLVCFVLKGLILITLGQRPKDWIIYEMLPERQDTINLSKNTVPEFQSHSQSVIDDIHLQNSTFCDVLSDFLYNQ